MSDESPETVGDWLAIGRPLVGAVVVIVLSTVGAMWIVSTAVQAVCRP